MPANKSALPPAPVAAIIKGATPKVGQNLDAKHSAYTKVIQRLAKEADKDSVEARVSVNQSVLMRGISKSISNFGNNPLPLIAKNSVKKGISLKPASAVVSKKTKTRKEVSKALNSEIAKLVTTAPTKPSEVKAKKEIAAVKVLVNTEILKQAALTGIKKKSAPKSPLKSPSKRLALDVSEEKPAKVALKEKKEAPKVPAAPKVSPPKTGPVDAAPKASARPKRAAKAKKRSYTEDE